MSEQEPHKEPMELTHEPVRGYPTALYVVVGIAAAYLAIIFLSSL
ncbi:MAG: hypothetical protein ACQERN_04525 [Thermodesulfobacteriota bacterium]